MQGLQTMPGRKLGVQWAVFQVNEEIPVQYGSLRSAKRKAYQPHEPA